LTNYIVRRLFETIPVLLGVSILVFLFIHIIPGDPAITLLGERATEENIERIREQLGLNKPIFLNFQGSTAKLLGEDSARLVEQPDSETVAGEITAEYALTVVGREDGWVRVNAILREEGQGWVQDEYATVGSDGSVAFSEERLRAFDEPVERGARRLGSIETSTMTVLSTGDESWFEVAWSREVDRAVGWIPEEQLNIQIKPFDSQYFIYMGRILRGDLGRTIQGRIPVANELRRRMPATIELSVYALFVSVLFGVPIGVLSAVWRNSVVDSASMIGALIGVSMPIFWLGLMMIYIFSIRLQALPMVGRLDVDSNLNSITGMYTLDALLQLNFVALWDALRHLLMPTLVLATVPISVIARITRSSMLEVLHQDYIRAARAKGVIERKVIFKHALRNALMPVVTVVGLQLGTLLSGAVLTETVFTWPGIGRWAFDAILRREYPIIQSVTLVVAFLFVMINLTVDVLYAVLNPRIRLS